MQLKNRSKSYFYLAALVLISFGFVILPINNYPADADADLIMSEIKIRLIGNNEYKFTQAYANFYSNNSSSSFLSSSGVKINNGIVMVGNTQIPFISTDSTYKLALDTTLENKLNFVWSFLDLTDSNNVITYSTTKALNRLDYVDLSLVNSVSKSTGFSFYHPPIIADSIIYLIGSDSLQSVKKKVLLQSNGVVFTPTELSSLANTTTGSFVILVFNIMPQTFAGKKYYFQNNSIASVMPLPIVN